MLCLQKTSVNVENYILVLKILQQHTSRSRHELIRNWRLYHDNAGPHVAISIQQYLSKNSIKKKKEKKGTFHLQSRFRIMRFLAISDVQGEIPSVSLLTKRRN